MDHTELGSRLPLISFEGHRAPVHPWTPPPKAFKDHRTYIYWQCPQPHGLSAQVNDTNPIPHDDLLSSPGDLPELCHHTTELSSKQVSSPVSSTSPSPPAFLKTFFRSLI